MPHHHHNETIWTFCTHISVSHKFNSYHSSRYKSCQMRSPQDHPWTTAAISISRAFQAASFIFLSGFPLLLYLKARVSPTLFTRVSPECSYRSTLYPSEFFFSSVHPHRSPNDISCAACVAWVNGVVAGRLWIGLEISKW